jgi:hypothetical protein
MHELVLCPYSFDYALFMYHGTTDNSWSRKPLESFDPYVKNPYNYRGSRNCKLNSIGHFSPIISLSLPEACRDICARSAPCGDK